MTDFRSKTSTLFRSIGSCVPDVAATVLNDRIRSTIATYGANPNDVHIDPTNKQLTKKSTSVIKFEALCQPVESVLSEIPDWAQSPNIKGAKETKRQQKTRAVVQAAVSEMSTSIVNWSPTFVWLKCRHAALLEALRHFWKQNPSTLLQGVDRLLNYLGLPDEWNPSQATDQRESPEMAGLKKRSGVALVSIAKQVPNHLVMWLSQLSEATRRLLASDALAHHIQMYLYELLTCVSAAIEDDRVRVNFISDVLSDAIGVLEAPEIQQAVESPESLLGALGVTRAGSEPASVADEDHVNQVSRFYARLFNPLNRLLHVGRRCHEAGNKKTILGGLQLNCLPPFGGVGEPLLPPDEAALSIAQLCLSDPFVPLWQRILPILLKTYCATLGAWKFTFQVQLLQNSTQRYLLAISDDEAYMAKDQNSTNSGGVFGEDGTAGSVIAGLDRRKKNLLPRWAGWMNELRSTCFQLFGLLMVQRVLYSPEHSLAYPEIVRVLADPVLLRSMEHRHMNQFLKQTIELLLVSCPSTMYATHLAPIIGPVLEHLRDRMEKSWKPVIMGLDQPTNPAVPQQINPTNPGTKALRSDGCHVVPVIAGKGEAEWFEWYYAHSGVFVGELDLILSEAVVEKHRMTLNRTFSEIIQVCFALRGDWALVLANYAKEDRANKTDNGGTTNPASNKDSQRNANGTPKLVHQAQIDARKLLRINGICRFLLLESDQCALNLTLAAIQSLCFPDAHSCRRMIKVLHRVLETVAWSPVYSQLLGEHLFGQALKNIVVEPKWMVGVEWDMINLIRDIYCRLCLGQWLQFGGQGPANQQPVGGNGLYEQTKFTDQPLQGGGVLVASSPLPRQILANLPTIDQDHINALDCSLKAKRSAKAQKDLLRDFLREAADGLGTSNGFTTPSTGLFSKALMEESLLHEKSRKKVPDLPEKLVIRASQIASKENETQPPGLNSIFPY